MKTQFTDKQIQDFRDYEEVRSDGKYNMLDPRARSWSGLTKEEYLFVMDNYSELREVAESK